MYTHPATRVKRSWEFTCADGHRVELYLLAPTLKGLTCQGGEWAYRLYGVKWGPDRSGHPRGELDLGSFRSLRRALRAAEAYRQECLGH